MPPDSITYMNILSDRLALMYFNDTEVWRTSTAEPTIAPGIRWTYLKDMTEYLSLWNSPQKLIFGEPFPYAFLSLVYQSSSAHPRRALVTPQIQQDPGRTASSHKGSYSRESFIGTVLR